jgi:hypothetical protein
MKRMYENFDEIGEDFRDGMNWPHRCSDHTSEECHAWQHGVMEFARWLDKAGLCIVQNPQVYEKLWDSFRTHKPDNYKECCKEEK